MRIAFLTTEYPTEKIFAGGLASYLRRIGMSLVDLGHEVEVFTISHTNEFIYDEKIRVIRVNPGIGIHKLVSKTPYFWRYSSGYTEVLEPALKLAIALRKRHSIAPFDIVQAANYGACGIIAALWKKIPIITRVSSYEPLWRDAYRKPLSRGQVQIEKAEILQLRWSSGVYAPSRILSEKLKEKEGIKVRLIEPPVNLVKFSPNTYSYQHSPIKGDFGLFFGSIGLLKGCDRIVNVLPDLFNKNPDMRFVFIGRVSKAENGDPYDKYIMTELEKYHDRVMVLPEQKHSDLFPIVKKARFVVLPSKIDNLPNTCIEAMALGRVVIGTYGASFEQLIEDGVNGFLVSQNDDIELASCIQRVWDMSPIEREKMGNNAFKSLGRMNPHNTTEQLIAFFEEIIYQRR